MSTVTPGRSTAPPTGRGGGPMDGASVRVYLLELLSAERCAEAG